MPAALSFPAFPLAAFPSRSAVLSFHHRRSVCPSCFCLPLLFFSPLSLQPVGSKFGSGIFFLLDAKPGEKDAHLVPLKPPAAAAGAGGADDAPDAPAPEPFEWVVGQYY